MPEPNRITQAHPARRAAWARALHRQRRDRAARASSWRRCVRCRPMDDRSVKDRRRGTSDGEGSRRCCRGSSAPVVERVDLRLTDMVRHRPLGVERLDGISGAEDDVDTCSKEPAIASFIATPERIGRGGVPDAVAVHKLHREADLERQVIPLQAGPSQSFLLARVRCTNQSDGSAGRSTTPP